MTELEELKNHIEALEKRVEASDKKIALLEETLSTLGKFKASKEMGEYIERQQNAIRMADMLSSFSDETIDMTVQKASVANIQKQQASINEQIVAAIKKSKTNVVQDDGSSLKYLKYETIGNEIAITGCTAFDPVDIVIPEVIEGKPVTIIGERAFENSKIRIISFHNSLKSIENYAFCNCENLISVFGLNCNIGMSCFKECKNLSQIELGENVRSIGNGAFERCYNLSSINLENTQINTLSIFCFCDTSLKEISFPETLRTIRDMSLKTSSLNSIVIPEYIQEVAHNFTSAKKVAFLGMDTIIKEAPCRSYYWDGLVIYCLLGSKVQEYCQKFRIKCRPLSEFPSEHRIKITDISIPLHTNFENTIQSAVSDLCTVLREIIRKS